MTGERIVSVESIEAALAVLAEFNALHLDQITLTEKGVPIELSQANLEDFRFTGLANHNFVEMRHWEELGTGP